MKKALIVLLLLAFVAGGLFAQFSFAGHVNSGLVMSILDSSDDPLLGVAGKADGASGGRYQVTMTATNEAKTAGMTLRLRAAGTAQTAFQPRLAFGWLKFFDGMLTVNAGRFGGGNASFDPMSDGLNYWDNTTGIYAQLNPVDMFQIGFAGTLPNGTSFTGLKFTRAQGTVVLGVKVPDIMNINAQFAFNQNSENDKAAVAAYKNSTTKPAYGWVDTDNDPSTAPVWALLPDTAAKPAEFDGSSNIRAFVSFDVKAIKNFALQVTAAMNDLGNFSNAGNMIFSEFFGFYGIENLGLNLGFQEGISQAANADLYFKAWLWLTYALGNVVPRLDFAFAMGGHGMVDNLYNNSWFKTLTFNKDDLNMMIMPSVQFKIGGNFLEIGYGLEKGLSDKYWDKANHYIFVDLVTNF